MLLTSALLSVGAVACGGSSDKEVGSTSRAVALAGASGATSSNDAPSSSSPIQIGRDSNDGDDDPNSNDDDIVVAYGHAASQAEVQAVTTLIKSYYSAGAADEGRRICSLIYILIAEAIPEDYVHAPGLRGKTCAEVMTRVFKRRHRQMVAALGKLKVTGVRVGGEKGFATVYLGKTPEPYVVLHREGKIWKMESLFEERLP